MTTTTFQYIFSGSAAERSGIPLMMSYEIAGYISAVRESRGLLGPLGTDLDVMYFPSEARASFYGQGDVLVEPLVSKSEGFIGYAKLILLTPGVATASVSSKLIIRKARDAILKTPVTNLPGHLCSCGMSLLPTWKTQLYSKGPTMKLRIPPLFEADITVCIQCSEWPPMSDWPSRPRYWPSVDKAQKIMSLGCHLVPKSAPNDKDKTSWRFSFSVAEVELSKLVPVTAKKCFLALKIILKDHLQPVAPAISSYHIKTIFLNFLEKVPVGFWVESNIEECFLALLTELRDALVSKNCRHHWFSFINLFGKKQTSCFCIETKSLQRLAKKVQTILNDPAPFIFDDGCCCLSPCCFHTPQNNFTRRTSEQFLAEYDEVMLSADGHVIAGAQNPADPGNNRYQFSTPSSPRCEAQLNPSLCSSENHSEEITTEPEQLVASTAPIQDAEQGPSRSCSGEAEEDSFRDSLPILVFSPLREWLTRFHQ